MAMEIALITTSEPAVTPNLNQNVLIVDDDLRLLKTVARWMKFKKWDVSTASNGKAALDRFSKDKELSLVLTDFNMPEMNGLLFAKKIKDIDPMVPVILLTGTDSELIEKERNISCVDYILYKPFSLRELDNAVCLQTVKE